MLNWKRKCEKCGRWIPVKIVSVGGNITYSAECECGNKYLYINKKEKEKEEET